MPVIIHIGRVSIECHKTKTKVTVITVLWPIKKDGDNLLKVITRSQHEVRENVYVRATIGFGFTCDW